jgi:hypothetical protein
MLTNSVVWFQVHVIKLIQHSVELVFGCTELGRQLNLLS